MKKEPTQGKAGGDTHGTTGKGRSTERERHTAGPPEEADTRRPEDTHKEATEEVGGPRRERKPVSRHRLRALAGGPGLKRKGKENRGGSKGGKRQEGVADAT